MGRWMVIAAVLFGFIAPVFGQIQIDWTEIPHINGTTWTKNSKDSTTVNLGTPGGPHTWNFTSQPMGQDTCRMVVVPVASTPFADSFPTANLAYRSVEESDTAYQLYNLSSAYLITLGFGGVMSDTAFFWRYDPTDSSPLPLSYGDSYLFHYGYTVEQTPLELRYDHYGRITCDAYGTVVIPYGSFPCLRLRVDDTLTMVMYVNQIPIMYDTTTHINYQFPAEDYSAVVCIFSYAEETNPNYSNAWVLERLTYYATGIEETVRNRTTIAPFHSPNPFSHSVTITYTLAAGNSVELAVYDAQGRLVRTLMKTQQGPGDYSVVWDGTHEDGRGRVSDGVYFYRLKIGNDVSMEKIVLIR